MKRLMQPVGAGGERGAGRGTRTCVALASVTLVAFRPPPSSRSRMPPMAVFSALAPPLRRNAGCARAPRAVSGREASSEAQRAPLYAGSSCRAAAAVRCALQRRRGVPRLAAGQRASLRHGRATLRT